MNMKLTNTPTYEQIANRFAENTSPREVAICLFTGAALGLIFANWAHASVAVPVAESSRQVVYAGGIFFGSASMVGVLTIATLLGACFEVLVIARIAGRSGGDR